MNDALMISKEIRQAENAELVGESVVNLTAVDKRQKDTRSIF